MKLFIYEFNVFSDMATHLLIYDFVLKNAKSLTLVLIQRNVCS
jgi:hypothetical protein